MYSGWFAKCKFELYLGNYSFEHIYKIDDIIETRSGKLQIIKQIRMGNNNRKGYDYLCLNCGNEDSIAENHLKEKNGCNVCGVNPLKLVVGINDITTTDPWMVKYFQGGYDEAKLYIKGTKQKIVPICPDCGRIKDKPISIYSIYKNKSIGCSCGDKISYPNKIGFSVLEQLNVDFKSEHTFKEMRFDFYFELDNNKYAVEMDGRWHKVDNKMSGQTKEESMLIDENKDNIAKEHDIEVIRIDCAFSDLEYIKSNIIKSKLNTIFDLELVDWIKCEEFALKNLVKEICIIWDNGKRTISELAEIYKLSTTTIRSYLHKGVKLGWCNYNSNMKKIVCTTTGEIFKSISEAGKKYKIKSDFISECCSGFKQYVICPITGIHLEWKYHEDCINNTKSIATNNKEVICVTTGEIFNSITDAIKRYNLNSVSGISACCRGKAKSAGTLETGEKLIWKYYNKEV